MEYYANTKVYLDGRDNKYLTYAKQLDTARTIKVQVIDNSVPVMLSSYSKAEVRWLKADGNEVHNDCTINSENYVVVELTQQMLAAEGRAQFEIILFDSSNKYITTGSTTVQINKNVHNDSSLESSSEYLTFKVATENAISKANTAAQNCEHLVSQQIGISTTEIDGTHAFPNVYIRDNYATKDLLSFGTYSISAIQNVQASFEVNNIIKFTKLNIITSRIRIAFFPESITITQNVTYKIGTHNIPNLAHAITNTCMLIKNDGSPFVGIMTYESNGDVLLFCNQSLVAILVQCEQF